MRSSHAHLGLLAALAAIVCLTAAHPAAAQEKHTLQMNAKVGQSWDFESTLESDMSMKSSAGGQVQNNDSKMTQKRVGTATVKEVANGVPSALTVAFGKDCSSSVTANGQTQSMPFPLAGQTVTLKRGPEGITTDFKGQLDPATQAEIEQMMEFDTSMYPQQPVAVGGDWTPAANKLKEQLQLAPNDKLDVTCKLLKVGSIRGVKTYDVSVTGNVAKNEGGMQMTVKIGGVMQLDVVTGMPVQNDVVVQLNLNGKQQAPGPDGQPVAIDLTGGGTIRMSGAAMPKEGFGGGGEAVGPVPQPEPGPNPLDPPVNPLDPPMKPKPKNPLAGDEEASPFQGTFKGKQLGADFKVDGEKVTGSIKLGDRSFPATGTIANGQLKGSFEADGAKFDFVASLEGQTMTLDSEGSKYTLQKEAAAAPVKPANPLE